MNFTGPRATSILGLFLVGFCTILLPADHKAATAQKPAAADHKPATAETHKPAAPQAKPAPPPAAPAPPPAKPAPPAVAHTPAPVPAKNTSLVRKPTPPVRTAPVLTEHKSAPPPAARIATRPFTPPAAPPAAPPAEKAAVERAPVTPAPVHLAATPIHMEQSPIYVVPAPIYVAPTPVYSAPAPPHSKFPQATAPPAERGPAQPPERLSLSRNTITNEGVVVLARAGYGEKFIADLIRSKPAKFDTSVEGLAFLAQQGIPESLVRRIIETEERSAREESAPPEKAAVSAVAPAPVAMRTVRAELLVPQDQAAMHGGSQKDVWYVVGQQAYRVK